MKNQSDKCMRGIYECTLLDAYAEIKLATHTNIIEDNNDAFEWKKNSDT